MAIKVSSRKQKGRKLQQYVAQRVSDLLNIPCGKDELIRSREMSQAGTDVCLIGKAKEQFPYDIECKAVEKMSLYTWIDQSIKNTKEDSDWLLFHKKSYKDPIVIMDAEVFFKLYEELIKWRKDNAEYQDSKKEVLVSVHD